MKSGTRDEWFWSKVNKTDTCWLWTASTHHGYGQFNVGGTMARAHRVAYEMMVGPIPEGLVIDHLCRNTICVNPAHLEVVSQGENVRRGLLVGPRVNKPTNLAEMWSAKTECPSGHPYDAANTYITPAGSRACRTCKKERTRVARLSRKVAV